MDSYVVHWITADTSFKAAVFRKLITSTTKNKPKLLAGQNKVLDNRIHLMI